MHRIVTWNINGFRSILRKGHLYEILANNNDIICFQEAKISNLDIVRRAIPNDYFIYDNLSSNARNGVLVLSKIEAIAVEKEIGYSEFDSQGRFLKIQFPDFFLINLYMPHGGRDKRCLPYKLKVGTLLELLLRPLSNKKTIIATDLNIARNDIDVCRASINHNNIMFTDDERLLLRNILCLGYKDVYRELNPQTQKYSWWSYAFECRKRNIGWRIDYFLVSSHLLPFVNSISINSNQYGSDHCPIVMEIEVNKNG